MPDSPVFASVAPPASGVRLAVAVVALIGVLFLAAAPFARHHVGPIYGFVAIYEAMVYMADLVTAVLLLSQFSRVGRLGLLILASGYLFESLMIVAHALSFPGLFAPGGLLGAQEQTTIWLYVFWHGGFICFLIAYAATANSTRVARPTKATFVAVAGLIAICAALGYVAFVLVHHLPRLNQGLDHSRAVTTGVAPAVWGLSLVAIALLWKRRQRSVLDLWVLVVAAACSFEVAMALLVGSSRFDFSFYVNRGLGLVTSTTVLCVLLFEMNRLYGMLAGAAAEAESRAREIERLWAEQKELERAVAESRRLESIGMLTGGLAHDFNNLLMIVGGSLGRLSKRLADPRDLQTVENASLATARAAKLVQQMLAFARKQSLSIEAVDANEIIGGMDELLRVTLGGQCTLRFDLAPDLWPAKGDRAQVESAIMNLVVNAKDASEAGRTTEVRTRNIRFAPNGKPEEPQAGEYVALEVVDGGSGMSEAVARKAFEPFFTTKPTGRGSGLGLSQVLGIAKQMGGGVGLASTLGAGTKVVVYLPKSDERVGALRSSPDGARAAGLAGLRVLVVDDEPLIREIARDWLEAEGCVVACAAGGGEALAAVARDGAPGVCVLDYAMPEMNGAQVADALRSSWPDLPILFASGHPADILDGAQKRREVLQKPFSRHQLLAALEALVAGRATAPSPAR